MRRKFQTRLLLLLTLAFAASVSVSWVIQTRHAGEDDLSLISHRLDNAREEILQNQEDLRSIRAENEAGVLRQLRVARWMLENDPDVGKDAGSLRKLLPVLDVDQIHIIDGQGVITVSTEEGYAGYRMDSATQSAWFLPVLKTPGLEMVQEAQPIGRDGSTVMQFAATGLTGQGGMVQVGNVPERLEESLRLADIRRWAPSLHIGSGGVILVVSDGRVVSGGGSAFEGASLDELGIGELEPGGGAPVTLKGRRYLGMAVPAGPYRLVGALPFGEVYAGRNQTLLILALVFLLLFLLLFRLVSRLVDREVIRGIAEVNRSLSRITSGDLEARAEVRHNDEFRSLSDGINTTVSALRQANAEAAARMEAELAFAGAIQQASLPRLPDPVLSGFGQFRLDALIAPSREVGGDFYDFFLAGEAGARKLAFAIADVSGKGIPGALYMMNAMTQLRGDLALGLTLGDAVAKTNAELCRNNDAGMFVTAFVGLWDFEGTGFLEYVVAGHNPPLLSRAGRPFHSLTGRPDLVLGAMPETPYTARNLRLYAGDRLLLYTDGVTEARGPKGDLFSLSRLLRLLNGEEAAGAPAAECIRLALGAAQAFSEGRGQADDITLLGLDILESKASPPLIRLKAQPVELPALQEFIEKALAPFHAGQGALGRLLLIAEEVFVNVCLHGGLRGEDRVEVACDAEGDTAVMRFADAGVPFDPLSMPLPDTDAPAAERPEGGLGVLLARRLADEATYERAEGRNRLEIRVRLRPGGQSRRQHGTSRGEA